ALGVLALGAASIGLAAPATWAATMDLGGARFAASVMAVANMAGEPGALLCPGAGGGILHAPRGRREPVVRMLPRAPFPRRLCWIFLELEPDRSLGPKFP